MAASPRRCSIEVEVQLKPGIFDAEADTVRKALKMLSVSNVTAVATARLYRLEFTDATPEEAERLARSAVDRLLANPVIHTVRIRGATD